MKTFSSLLVSCLTFAARAESLANLQGQWARLEVRCEGGRTLESNLGGDVTLEIRGDRFVAQSRLGPHRLETSGRLVAVPAGDRLIVILADVEERPWVYPGGSAHDFLAAFVGRVFSLRAEGPSRLVLGGGRHDGESCKDGRALEFVYARVVEAGS